MSEEASTNSPSPEAVQAAAAAAAEAPAAPAPPSEPEIEEIPEGDTFDRAYVEKLRGEAAKHRTRARSFEEAFAGYTDAEQARFLDLAKNLNHNPEAALEEFRSVTNRLAGQLGKEPIMSEDPTNTNPAQAAEVAAPSEAASPAVSALTAADIDALVESKLAAAQQQQQQQSEVERTFAEAEALDPAYKDPAAKAHLFAVAQQNGTDLAGAHNILTDQLQTVIDKAVSEHMEGLRSGRVHPPRTPAGSDTTSESSGSPSTLAEAKARATERFRAAGMG